MSVLESFAYGKSVIGADIGGIPELVIDGVDGFLVPSAGTEALREKLLWMFEHKDEAAEMGKTGRKKMETEFNADIHYQKIFNIYEKVL